jgi:methylated-DNA-[protein]-cysteine S-methyltransferase
MTCTELARHVDAFLAGDLTEGEASGGVSGVGALTAHTETCADCRRLWSRAQQLPRVGRAGKGDERFEQDAARGVGRARDQLRAAFGRMGRPPVRFGSLRAPIGRVFVGVSDRGVCDVTFGESNEDRYRRRLARWAPEVSRDPDAVGPALGELDAYFSGRLERFTVEIDLRTVTAFTARVLSAARIIPFGWLLSYGEMAHRIGAPGASRAVGGALGRNPVPIMVPCHRVIAQGGRLGGFTGGLNTKRALLRIEGHTITALGRVKL